MPTSMEKKNVIFQGSVFDAKKETLLDVNSGKAKAKSEHFSVSLKSYMDSQAAIQNATATQVKTKQLRSYKIDKGMTPPGEAEIRKASGWASVYSRSRLMMMRCNEGQSAKVINPKDPKVKYAPLVDSYIKVGLIKESNVWKVVARFKYGKSSHFGEDIELLTLKGGVWTR